MPEPTSKVKFFFVNTSPAIKNRNELKKFLLSIFRKEQVKPNAITYIFTNDKYLWDINKKYLGHNFLTDIITFDLSQKDQPITAEIYISVERVKENASTHNTTFRQELHRVIFHGVLHLCGYNDKTSVQMRQMREKENHYLLEYFK